ncbi:hypothetical protein GCM10022198_13700 [Klugiella xanthotipulae]|uniref:Uncharacterized protein with NRDE domain n=1 Tax=Klugiella xanthotipulae TaxID=244735 RepID=A0A543I4G0_9MICO|nr:NRDE family protein [Klugiella xanthotipulae]TQM65457.1 uncharacterized protein with NRDE domain [Klugiella xanthotipulae]
MCTVIVSIDPASAWPVVLLGMRDELITRPWDPPGAWWPELCEHIRGIRDREAGGAWLAVNGPKRRASVVLNRGENVVEPPGGWTTRGELPLIGSTTGIPADSTPTTRPFNLLTVTGPDAEHTSWNGHTLTTTQLTPGVHMLTHEGPDETAVPRVHRWLPAFRGATAPTGPISSGTWAAWLGVLRDSAELPSTSPEALLREEGPGLDAFRSLSVSAVAVGRDDVSIEHARLTRPGTLDRVLAWR